MIEQISGENVLKRPDVGDRIQIVALAQCQTFSKTMLVDLVVGDWTILAVVGMNVYRWQVDAR